MSRIDGVKDLEQALSDIGSADLEPIIRKWTEYVRGEAIDLCPVDTGELRQSIHTDVVTRNGEATGIVYTNKEYAPYVEFGTGKRGAETNSNTSPDVHVTYSQDINGQAAQPFLYPALNNNQTRVLKGIQDDIKKQMGG